MNKARFISFESRADRESQLSAIFGDLALLV